MSGILYEHWATGGFLVSEEEAHRSRDAGTISNSGGSDLPLDAGLVLTNGAGTPVAAAASTNTGNGTISAVTVQPGGGVGTYVVRMTAATTFRVFAPSGQELDAGATGTAYTEQLGFTITAGATAFVAGDEFIIAVPSTGWAPYTATTAPFSLGVLFNRTVVPAGGSTRVTVVTRQAQVNQAELQWDASVAAAGGIVSAAGANTGNGTIGSLSIISALLIGGVEPNVPAGAYTLTATSPTTFEVLDPTEHLLQPAQVGTAYAQEIGFTITQGATLFAEGDSFTVTVTENGQVQALAALRAAGIIAR